MIPTASPRARSQTSMLRRGLWVVALLSSAARVAAADPVEGDGPDAPPPVNADETARTGAFLPYGAPANAAAQRAYITAQGGYDGARGGAVFATTAQANLVGPLSLRAGAAYAGPTGTFRPSVALTVQALRQSAHGVDLSVYAGYQAQGFNLVPAASVMVAVSRTMGRLTLLGNVGYGYGTEAGEQYGEAHLAGMVRATDNLHVGLDARARVDLERDADEPENEPDWDLVAGPVATWTVGHFALTATGGLSAIRFRNGDAPVALGAIGQLLVGSSF
jgi:hypothetical protein